MRDWPSGTGQMLKLRTLIVASDTHACDELAARELDPVIVSTPLDMILELDREDCAISTIVLAGVFPELASFLHETYPDLEIVEERP
jgi:hypothetical protein